MSAKTGQTVEPANSPVWAGANNVEVVLSRGNLDAFDWATLRVAVRQALMVVHGTASDMFITEGKGAQAWDKPEDVRTLLVSNPLLTEPLVRMLESELKKIRAEFEQTIFISYGHGKVI